MSVDRTACWKMLFNVYNLVVIKNYAKIFRLSSLYSIRSLLNCDENMLLIPLRETTEQLYINSNEILFDLSNFRRPVEVNGDKRLL